MVSKNLQQPSRKRWSQPWHSGPLGGRGPFHISKREGPAARRRLALVADSVGLLSEDTGACRAEQVGEIRKQEARRCSVHLYSSRGRLLPRTETASCVQEEPSRRASVHRWRVADSTAPDLARSAR